MLTNNQEYAIKALEKVTAVKDRPEAKAYGSMAHKLPILIRSAGLAQALTFVEARGKDIQRTLLSDLASTLDQEDRTKFLGNVRNAHLKEYMFLTRQTLGALLWYKRFAQSVLGVDESDAIEDEGE